MKKNSSILKIIIVTFVIIIIFVLSIIVLLNILKKDNNVKDLNIIVNQNMQEKNELNEVVSEENIVIVEDSNETLNRKYGKIDVVWIDENNNVIENPLEPNLGELIPVKYNISTSTFEKTNLQDNDWFDYNKQKWANAIDENGSYFVWIPRFAYRIIYYEDEQYSKIIGYCDGRGILKLNDDETLTRITKNNTGIRETNNHYIVAPAFSKDIASGYKNGGWNKDLSGIWVAKFEMSMEVNGEHKETINANIGNVLINDSIKAVSKPAVSSWRNISINNCYLNCYNYNRNRDSHLIKNSEWGAIVYLSYSKYGTNGKQIQNNSNLKYLTGGTDLENRVYISNKNQSSNGNETGIYDLAGGAWEYTAAYIDNGYIGLKEYGGENDEDLYSSKNSKYKTIYANTEEDKGDNYNVIYSNKNYELSLKLRGDAIYETSSSGYGNNSWNTNSSFFPQNDITFFIRGGDYNARTGAGLFSFNGYNGSSNSGETFRVVLAF